MTIVGMPATGTDARCPECGYGTVQLVPGSAVILVHAASCPQTTPFDGYVACNWSECKRVLDPGRVLSYGAKTCNDRHRYAAWKERCHYGPHPDLAREPRSNGSQPGSETAPDPEVAAAREAFDQRVRDATPKKRRASGLQISYRKALGAVVDQLLDMGWEREEACPWSERALRAALSERQRQQLDARDS